MHRSGKYLSKRRHYSMLRLCYATFFQLTLPLSDGIRLRITESVLFIFMKGKGELRVHLNPNLMLGVTLAIVEEPSTFTIKKGIASIEEPYSKHTGLCITAPSKDSLYAVAKRLKDILDSVARGKVPE